MQTNHTSQPTCKECPAQKVNGYIQLVNHWRANSACLFTDKSYIAMVFYYNKKTLICSVSFNFGYKNVLELFVFNYVCFPFDQPLVLLYHFDTETFSLSYFSCELAFFDKCALQSLTQSNKSVPLPLKLVLSLCRC